MRARHDYQDEVARIFREANFIQDLGLVLDDVGPGTCETSLALTDRHLQQSGAAHAGVLATAADHTAGGAATSLCPPGQILMSISLNVNLMRAATGDRLICRARVIKPGARVMTAESDVFFFRDGIETLSARAMVTMAVVPDPAG